MSELRLDLTRDMPHPAGRIFDAWLDPAMLMKFMAPQPGMTVPEAQSDARQGGRFRILMRTAEGQDIPHHGEYLTVQRPEKLVFTWQSPHSMEGSTVTLALEPLPEGGTRVHLSQIRFANEQSRDGHVKGWTAILDALDAAL